MARNDSVQTVKNQPNIKIYAIYFIFMRATRSYKTNCVTQSLNKRPYYPCRCLCRGSLQITRTLPLRRITLQSRQIFFTEARTFIFVLQTESDLPSDNYLTPEEP